MSAAAAKRSSRIPSLEFVRFVAAVFILWTHLDEFTGVKPSAFSFVFIFLEYFFIITGFYLMAGAAKKDSALEPLESVRYTFRKASSIYLAYFLSLVFTFVVNIAISPAVERPVEILERLFHFKWEFLYLQMLGLYQSPQFNGDYLMGTGWYLSAMFIALVPVHYLARRFKSAFSDVAAPLLSCSIYYYCVQKYGTLNVGNEGTLLAMLGVVRAVAGLSMGAFIFSLSDLFSKTAFGERAARRIACVECASLLLVMLMPLLGATISRQTDALIYIPIFAALMIIGNSEHSAVNRALGEGPRRACVWLGKMSLYVYLFQWGFILAAKDFLAEIPGLWRYAVCFGLDMALSAAMMLFAEWVTALRKARKA